MSSHSHSWSVTPDIDSPNKSLASSAPAFDFFASVDRTGYPKNTTTKVRPWQGEWEGPQMPKNGKQFVACAKDCIYGSNNLGGRR